MDLKNGVYETAKSQQLKSKQDSQIGQWHREIASVRGQFKSNESSVDWIVCKKVSCGWIFVFVLLFDDVVCHGALTQSLWGVSSQFWVVCGDFCSEFHSMVDFGTKFCVKHKRISSKEFGMQMFSNTCDPSVATD